MASHDAPTGPDSVIDIELPLVAEDCDVNVARPATEGAGRPHSVFGRYVPTLSQVAAYPLLHRVRWPGLARTGYPDPRNWNWMREAPVGLSERAAGVV